MIPRHFACHFTTFHPTPRSFRQRFPYIISSIHTSSAAFPPFFPGSDTLCFGFGSRDGTSSVYYRHLSDPNAGLWPPTARRGDSHPTILVVLLAVVLQCFLLHLEVGGRHNKLEPPCICIFENLDH